MCFSASASFIAAGGLAVAGGVAVAIAPKKQKIIAVIPLLFAAQQAIEGFQWLALRSGSASMIAGYAFLFFAFILWPLYIPVAVYILDRRSHQAIRWLAALGGAVAVFLGWVLLTQPLSIGVLGHCIAYQINMPLSLLVTLSYALVVCGAPILSGRRAFQVFGWATFVSLVTAMIFFYGTVTSVWCFFAAILSGLILYFLSSKYPKAKG